jgi:two-component system sensor histidine kinase KdpD
MTRLEAGAVVARKEWHALEDALGPALQRLGPALRERQVSIRIPEDLPLVPMDDVLVEQVLINLLDNAAKYTPGMTPIEISAVFKDGAVEVTVADLGSGLGPEEVDRVFDKFYRGRKPSGRGAGLGLPICRGFIEAHGGRIWASNRPEGGAVFRFTLPLTGTPPDVRSEDD